MRSKVVSMLFLAFVLLFSGNLQAEEANNSLVQNVNNQPGAEDEAAQDNQQTQMNEDEIEGEGQDTSNNTFGEETEAASVNEVNLVLDSKIAKVNGQEYSLQSPPKIINGRTFLPLRFVGDKVLGADVIWNNASREITVVKGSNIVIIKVGAKTASVNGSIVPLDQPAVIENNSALLPLRFISETFGIVVDYNAANKTIKLISNPEINNKPIIVKPTAQFNFSQEQYIAGQLVQAVDTSYDENGSPIVERLWMINGDSNLTTPKLENIFKTPREGSYKISLRVRNSRGIWSDWAEQILIINPNEKPVVTNLTPSKTSFAQGENMRFTYSYNNEEWENIKSERWTYRRSDDAESKAVIDQPKALFAEGDYIVTLQLEDTYGNLGDKTETIIHITSEVLKSELTYKFTEGQIGDIIDNYKKFNYQSYQEVLPYESSVTPETLIMSDSPEIVYEEGILYKGTLNGSGRILLHHISDFGADPKGPDNKRLVLIAENTTNQPVHIITMNKVIKGPVEDTLYMGQQILYEYLKGSGGEDFILMPGEKRYIYDSVKKKWLKGQCISGLMDMVTDGKINLTAAAVGPSTSIDDIKNMKLLDRSIHTRGTFAGTHIYYKVNLQQGNAQKLIIGKGTAEWVNGNDEITSAGLQNKGNFGVSYHITITAEEDMGIILNPRADIFRGAVKWENGGTYLMPSKGFFSGDVSKASVLGTIKAGETKEFEYMLPNGSSAPVLIGFIPQKMWDN